MSRGAARGFTLLEVVVALVVLEVGLLGAVGVLVVAARTLGRATLVERAAGEAAAVADSLSRHRVGGAGEVTRDGWRVTWAPGEGGLRVQARPPGRTDGEALAEVWVP